jgi:hypothetical protein
LKNGYPVLFFNVVKLKLEKEEIKENVTARCVGFLPKVIVWNAISCLLTVISWQSIAYGQSWNDRKMYTLRILLQSEAFPKVNGFTSNKKLTY